MSGAECSTSSPLQSLLKQQGTDNSLHNSSFSQQNPGPSLRTRSGLPPLAQEEAERFYAQNGNSPAPAFEMERLRQQLEGVSREGAIKGDRGELLRSSRSGWRLAAESAISLEWASQYQNAPAPSQMEMAAMEEQFRQANSSELSGLSISLSSLLAHLLSKLRLSQPNTGGSNLQDNLDRLSPPLPPLSNNSNSNNLDLLRRTVPTDAWEGWEWVGWACKGGWG